MQPMQQKDVKDSLVKRLKLNSTSNPNLKIDWDFLSSNLGVNFQTIFFILQQNFKPMKNHCLHSFLCCF
jgi:hypothetical protein